MKDTNIYKISLKKKYPVIFSAISLNPENSLFSHEFNFLIKIKKDV